MDINSFSRNVEACALHYLSVDVKQLVVAIDASDDTSTIR